MPRLHTRAAPTFHETGRPAEGVRRCTVTLTGHSEPARQLPDLFTRTAATGPACRAAIVATPRGWCRPGVLCRTMRGWGGCLRGRRGRVAAQAQGLDDPGAPVEKTDVGAGRERGHDDGHDERHPPTPGAGRTGAHGGELHGSARRLPGRPGARQPGTVRVRQGPGPGSAYRRVAGPTAACEGPRFERVPGRWGRRGWPPRPAPRAGPRALTGTGPQRRGQRLLQTAGPASGSEPRSRGRPPRAGAAAGAARAWGGPAAGGRSGAGAAAGR